MDKARSEKRKRRRRIRRNQQEILDALLTERVVLVDHNISYYEPVRTTPKRVAMPARHVARVNLLL